MIDNIYDNMAKLEYLMKIEKEMQNEWRDNCIFEDNDHSKPKYFGTFPYPYMNGTLHLGHSFTISKVEFAMQFERMRGKSVLFPFGFHCTGMPIKAAADKLKYELANGKAAEKSQIDILMSMGIEESDIPRFADAEYWLKYFPPIAMNDLKKLGLGIDWRRSFITTSVNPHYDSFIRWQFNLLKKLGKIKFGKRNTIWSPKDGQPCMDHDRSVGEGIGIAEYTMVRMELMVRPKVLWKYVQTVYLVACVEDIGELYRQTGCKVDAEAMYGVCRVSDDEIYICSTRAANNLGFQGYMMKKMEEIAGSELIGKPVRGVLTKYPVVYCVNGAVDMSKKTGIEVVTCALEGYDEIMYTGVLTKPDNKDLAKYAEPEGKIISRSGDECVVALMDQWYIDYGEEKWRAEVAECLKNMNMYSEDTQKGLEDALGWLEKWACSRTYGLGTRMPFDEAVMIDSLSDSTIYMAYYTVSHLLEGIDAAKMTYEVWDYIFLEKKYPVGCGIDEKIMRKMKEEFMYWYPMDLRVSGKDLMKNHLIFCLYNHVAIWKGKSPRGFRINGHMLLDGEKMAKSTGNFLTLAEGVSLYSADGLRLTLADCGDGMDDANFERNVAEKYMLRLHTMVKWCDDVIRGNMKMRMGDMTFDDKVFENEINRAIAETEEHYSKLNFRDGLKSGYWNLQIARDNYRKNSGEMMHRDLVFRYIEVQMLLLAPITPHVAEYVWKLLGKDGSIRRAMFPVGGKVDEDIVRKDEYIRRFMKNYRGKGVVYVAREYPQWIRESAEMIKKSGLKDRSEIINMLVKDETCKKHIKKIIEWMNSNPDYDTEMKFDEKELLEGYMKGLNVKYGEDIMPGYPVIRME